MRKKAVITPLGMNRDLAMSKFDPRFVFENHNMRLVTDKATSKFVLTNEKGPALLDLSVYIFDNLNKVWQLNNADTNISGKVLGCTSIDNHLILFTQGNMDVIDPVSGEIETITVDFIYRIDIEDDATDGRPVKCYQLFRGDMGFDLAHPIETLPFYETADIKKVYWTDGINQPRMINIMADPVDYTAKTFDFAQEISGYETINVTRKDNTNGIFPSGVIQYAFTYYRKYGQESSVAGISPMLFIADDNRGSAPDETVYCCYKIQLSGLSQKFDGVRIYSIIRTSENTVPIVKRLADVAIKKNNVTGYGTAEYLDVNSGEDMESTYLLYVGAKKITCETLTQKDNTAFYGNINLKNGHLDDALREKIRLGKKTGGAFTALGFANNKTIQMPQTWGKYNFDSQLRGKAEDIRFFQYRETYRFGVQLQDRYGNWSEVIRIESDDVNHGYDFYQGVKPTSDVKQQLILGNDVLAEAHDDLTRNVATFGGTFSLSGLGSMLDEYVAIRPVVVYPGNDDRSVLAQGILTPTVYNLEDRINNGTYGQMSWFSRPICSEDDMFPSEPVGNITQANQISDYKVLEFRHYRPLPPTNQFEQTEDNRHFYHGSGAELLCNFEGYKYGQAPRTIDYTFWANVSPWQEKSLVDSELTGANPSVQERATQLRSEYFVDQSVETFHSPDVEYTDMFAKMDMDGVRMRIVGVVPVTYHNEGVYMAADEITYRNRLNSVDRDIVLGGEQDIVSVESIIARTRSAYKQFTEFGGVQANFEDTFDSNYEYHDADLDAKIKASYWGTNKVYPWHTKTLTHEITGWWPYENNIRERSVMPDMIGWLAGRRRSSLAKKIYDSLRYSYDTIYLVDPCDVSIDTPKYFNTVDGGITKIDVDGQYMNFDFNVDKMVIPNTRVFQNQDNDELRYTNAFIYPGTGKLVINDLDNNSVIEDITGCSKVVSTEAVPLQYRGTTSLVMHLSSADAGNGNKKVEALPKLRYYSPVDQQYHFYNDIFEYQNGSDIDGTINIEWADSESEPLTERAISMSGRHFMWDSRYVDMEQKTIPVEQALSTLCNRKYGIYYLAELYREVEQKFGGNSEEALASNIWVPCGNSVSLRDINGALLQTVNINWTMGDTYYQRYDNLHTYPYTEDDVNQVVEIVSFMCETRVNIDGRYDRNRGLDDNKDTRPTNANRLNNVYGQRPNYFQYRAIDHNRIINDSYPTTVVWTKTKQLGEFTDSWTNITLANTMDMDGSKGEVNALTKHFDDILVFQDTGISRILFNEQQAIQTESGVPLEIANSGKVTGKHYLSSVIGCHNKWSIAHSPNGTYFADDAQKDIYFISSERQIKSVAIEKGFRSWVREKSDMAHTWDPANWSNLRAYYDKLNCEVLFVDNNEALSFNEQLGQFTSFYDYGRVPFFESVKGHNILTYSQDYLQSANGNNSVTRLYEHNAGEYNNFFGIYKRFWTELICHSDGTENDSTLLDKTWTNVRFQFDTFDDSKATPNEKYRENERFDIVECSTEYQQGITDWRGSYPGISKTFRMWNADLPRDGYTLEHQGYTSDRFRNPWLRLRLTKKENINKNWRSVLHSVTIGYLE